MNRKLNLALMLLLALQGMPAFAQTLLGGSNAVPANVARPTSNAEALGKYGDVPVSLFNGRAQISVPLHEIQSDGIRVPISLNYDASGIRVDQYPTWVGLGWNLQAGGCITRSVKGAPDDFYFRDHGAYSNAIKGYLYSHSLLDNVDWYSSLYLMLIGQVPFRPGLSNPSFVCDGQPDDFHFNFNGYSGTFFLDETGQWRVKSQSKLGLEIEHQLDTGFVFGNCQHDGLMKISSLITQFKITTPDGFVYTFGGYKDAMEYSRAAQDDSNFNLDNPQYYNIMPTAWYLTEIRSPWNGKVTFNYESGKNLIRHARYVVSSIDTSVTSNPGFSEIALKQEVLSPAILTPNYLASIETPYQKLVFHRSYTTEMQFSSAVVWRKDNTNMSLADFECQFFNTSTPLQSQFAPYRAWIDFFCMEYFIGPRPRPAVNSNQRIPNWAEKLDSIQVIDLNKQQVAKTLAFQYTGSTDTRLFLLGLEVKAPQVPTSHYGFDYINMQNVPNYNSFQKDHWGYFNNDNYAANYTFEQMYKFDNWRQPDKTFCEYGTLKKITYPTSGYTEFEYELHDYAQYQNVDIGPGHLVSVSLEAAANKKAGGLRIKKITSVPLYGGVPIVKEYFYNKNHLLGGGTSSGILSGIPQYASKYVYHNGCYDKKAVMTSYSDNTFLPWGESDIQTVGYSEVTEKRSDGSATVYKYTNYDTDGQALDEVSYIGFVLGGTETTDYALSSSALERGLLLSERQFDAMGQVKQEMTYEYEKSLGRKAAFAKCVRTFYFMKMEVLPHSFWVREISFCLKENFHQVFPYKKFYYNVPLKKTTETLYEENGSIAQSTTYAYDAYGNVTAATREASDGKRLTAYTRFNSHPDYLGYAAQPEAIGQRRLFHDYKIKNYPVERYTLQAPENPNVLGEDVYLDATLIQYRQQAPVPAYVYRLELERPLAAFTGSVPNLVPNFSLSKIDNAGNWQQDGRYVLQTSLRDYTAYTDALPKPRTVNDHDSYTAYTWDHRSRYQSSRTRNAEAEKVAFCSFEGSYMPMGTADDDKGHWDFDPGMISIGGFTGQYGLRLNLGNGHVLTSAQPLEYDRRYIVSYWAKGAEPLIQLGGSTNYSLSEPLKEAGDWKLYRRELIGNGQKLALVPNTLMFASSLLDDVRLQPAEGMMESYTYDPFDGRVLCFADEAHNVKFYTYDALGRLLYIKDEDGHILERYEYNIQQNQ